MIECGFLADPDAVLKLGDDAAPDGAVIADGAHPLDPVRRLGFVFGRRPPHHAERKASDEGGAANG
jgi:hypothetical protein